MNDDKKDKGETSAETWGETMARPEHEATYTLFLALTKWTAIGCAAILVFLLVAVYQ